MRCKILRLEYFALTHSPFENEWELDLPNGVGQVVAGEGAGHCTRQPGRTRCCNVNPFSDLGDPASGTTCSGARTMEKLSGSCRPVPSPVKSPVTWGCGYEPREAEGQPDGWVAAGGVVFLRLRRYW